ncbi:hypothetical protein FE236_00430 [Mariprofundus erugo]|uniref:hypothetical protein n=1 Tax=Mariprofundus erugo TaxID=2528639 RepID=UPI0010FF34DD|nr:hypothetical protein [Mariprofundus erugo]TLS78260.1 hypothetical protein FE236_00430 [Mariprofundus erugo]
MRSSLFRPSYKQPATALYLGLMFVTGYLWNWFFMADGRLLQQLPQLFYLLPLATLLLIRQWPFRFSAMILDEAITVSYRFRQDRHIDFNEVFAITGRAIHTGRGSILIGQLANAGELSARLHNALVSVGHHLSRKHAAYAEPHEQLRRNTLLFALPATVAASEYSMQMLQVHLLPGAIFVVAPLFWLLSYLLVYACLRFIWRDRFSQIAG